jgi:hypothetical protein
MMVLKQAMILKVTTEILVNKEYQNGKLNNTARDVLSNSTIAFLLKSNHGDGSLASFGAGSKEKRLQKMIWI